MTAIICSEADRWSEESGQILSHKCVCVCVCVCVCERETVKTQYFSLWCIPTSFSYCSFATIKLSTQQQPFLISVTFVWVVWQQFHKRAVRVFFLFVSFKIEFPSVIKDPLGGAKTLKNRTVLYIFPSKYSSSETVCRLAALLIYIDWCFISVLETFGCWGLLFWFTCPLLWKNTRSSYEYNAFINWICLEMSWRIYALVQIHYVISKCGNPLSSCERKDTLETYCGMIRAAMISRLINQLSAIKLIANYFDNRLIVLSHFLRKLPKFSDFSFSNVNIFAGFLQSSVTVNWIFLGCGLSKTFESITLVLWQTGSNIFHRVFFGHFMQLID